MQGGSFLVLEDFYSFIANLKFDYSDSFHDVVDIIFNRDGAKELTELRKSLALMLERFLEESSHGKTESSSPHLTFLLS